MYVLRFYWLVILNSKVQNLAPMIKVNIIVAYSTSRFGFIWTSPVIAGEQSPFWRFCDGNDHTLQNVVLSTLSIDSVSTVGQEVVLWRRLTCALHCGNCRKIESKELQKYLIYSARWLLSERQKLQLQIMVTLSALQTEERIFEDNIQFQWNYSYNVTGSADRRVKSKTGKGERTHNNQHEHSNIHTPATDLNCILLNLIFPSMLSLFSYYPSS